MHTHIIRGRTFVVFFLEFFSVSFLKKISVFIMWIMLRYWRNNKYNRYMLSVLTDTAAPHTTNVSESS